MSNTVPAAVIHELSERGERKNTRAGKVVDLIAAYDPEATGSLIGDKANSAVFDNRKIKRFVPEFTASVPWSEGVRRAIAWHEAHPEFCTIDREANARWDTILAAYRCAIPGAPSPGATG